jgi:hypothetical protein
MGKVTSITQGRQGRLSASVSQQMILSRRELFRLGVAATGSTIIAARRADVPFSVARRWAQEFALAAYPGGKQAA